jgi:hypothetical protein
VANPLINRARVRQLALDTFNGRLSSDLREHYGKERVSEEFLDRMEAKVRTMIVQELTTKPAYGGKTIK